MTPAVIAVVPVPPRFQLSGMRRRSSTSCSRGRTAEVLGERSSAPMPMLELQCAEHTGDRNGDAKFGRHLKSSHIAHLARNCHGAFDHRERTRALAKTVGINLIDLAATGRQGADIRDIEARPGVVVVVVMALLVIWAPPVVT